MTTLIDPHTEYLARQLHKQVLSRIPATSQAALWLREKFMAELLQLWQLSPEEAAQVRLMALEMEIIAYS